MVNVLYISYDGMTDPLGQSQVLPYLIGLSQQEYAFTLISFEKNENFLQGAAEIQKMCANHGIEWIPLRYTKRPPILSTIFDCWKMHRTAVQQHRSKQFQLVHCRSYISALIGLRLRKKGIQLIFDMRGFWADERVDGGIWNLNKKVYQWVYQFFKRKEKAFLQHADAVISLTAAGKKAIQSHLLPSIDENKIFVIPCCADLNLFNPSRFTTLEKSHLRESLQLSHSFVVGYVGSIGTWYMLDEMLELFKTIAQQHTNAIFLFITKEPPLTVWKRAEKLGIKREQLRIVSVQHREVPQYMAILDVAVFFIRPTFSKIASSPTKQGELMAMGIPLICNSGVGDTAAIVEQYKAGQVLTINQTESLSSFRFDATAFDSELTMKGAFEIYGLEQGVARYADIYQQLIKKNTTTKILQ